MGSLTKLEEVEVLIVGAGFSGIYQLYLARKAGFNAKVIDRAGDVGGTWYWNRYPGAMSDSEAYIYRYSWDKELLQTWDFPDHYAKQPNSLAYLEHVVEKYDLRRHMEFNVQVNNAQWNVDQQKWHVNTSQGVYVTTYLITALGLLTQAVMPDIPGLKTFKGELYHSSRFPFDWDFTGKRVGVVGSGSTGIQIITQLGKDKKVKSLVSFQRSPQYSVPSGDRPMTKEEREVINKGYDETWKQVKNSRVAFGFVESEEPAMSVSAEERERRFQNSWDRGNGFRFLYTFGDIFTNMEANLAACDFIKRKIQEIVKDPETARKLKPTEIYCRRPLCDAGYYEVFNEDFVHLVSLRDTPIDTITEKGVRTSDGTEHELDVLIFATGFDGVDGSYKSIDFKGLAGETLQQHWSPRPKTYLGVMTPNFPNFLMISGPLGPMCNQPPASETQAEFITKILEEARQRNAVVDALPEAEKGWVKASDESAESSLLKAGKSWFFGHNVPGKHHETVYFFAGLNIYRDHVADCIKDRKFKGFTFMPRGKKIEA